MKAPIMKKVASLPVITVKPDGGVNLADSPQQIADNQAANLLNLWYTGGVLRFRPGVVQEITQQYGKILDVYPRDGRKFLLKRISAAGEVIQEKHGVFIVTQQAVLSYDGAVIERIPCAASYSGGAWSYAYTDFAFDHCVLLPGDNIEYSRQDGANQTWKAEGGSVYLIGSGYYLTITPQIIYWPFPMGEVHVTGDYFVMAKQLHTPVLYRDTPPSGGGTANEARNFLTPRVSQTFTADASGTVYRLCDSGIDNDTVSVEYYNPATGGRASFVFDAGVVSVTASGITAALDRSKGTVTFSTAPVGAAGVRNNVTVTYAKTVYPTVPITHCTVGQWYGDQQSKNGGGSRIFLAGFADGANAVYYSAADDPSYFPADCVIRVGDPADPVTGFGAQFGVLVVLKEHSVYSIDSTADAAAFTLRQVHDGEGCDMPGSIRVAANMLVFANTAGGIYMLHSTQIRDERNLIRLSRQINPALLAISRDTLQSACAISTGWYYMLFAGDRAFCMCCDGGVLSGSVSELEAKLAFYLWCLPIRVGYAFLLGSQVYLAGADDHALYALDDSVTTDNGVWFPARWQSKAYDFGAPDALKKPRPALIGFLHSETAQIRAGFLTDGTQELEAVILTQPTEIGESRAAVYAGVPGGYARRISVVIERPQASNAAIGVDSLTLRAVRGAHGRVDDA